MAKDSGKLSLILLSLLATPVLLLVSNTLALYLGNQMDLAFQLALLQPYILSAAALYVLGLVLYALASKGRVKLLMWAYYLAGPCYLVFMLLRPIEPLALEAHLGFAVFLATCFALLLLIGWRLEPSDGLDFFALLSVLLIVSELFKFMGEKTEQNDEYSNQKNVAQLADPGTDKPNIYHLILDEFQTSEFSNAPREIKDQLNGFVLYEDASAVYDMTEWSIPSVFMGSPYDFSETVASYQDRALNSKQSALNTK